MPQVSLSLSAASSAIGEAEAAADHEQRSAPVPARRPRADQSAARRASQRVGQRVERRSAARRRPAMRDEARAGDQLRDEALGRGDARLGAGVQRQRPFGGVRRAANAASLTSATVRAPPSRK